MKGRFRVRVIDVMVVAAILAYGGWKGMARRAPSLRAAESSDQSNGLAGFQDKNAVDLTPFNRIAVQADGRLRSFESHATTFMGYVTGRRVIDGQSDGFTYLDMMFRPEVYEKADIIYVKKKPVRAKLIAALTSAGKIDRARGERILKSGLISKPLLREPVVASLLDRLGADLIRTAKDVNAIQSALTVSEPGFLEGQLRVIAPPDGSESSPWIGVSDLVGRSGAPQDGNHAGLGEPQPIPGLDPAIQQAVAAKWPALRDAWRAADVPTINRLIEELAEIFPAASSAMYPKPGRLAMESWYYRNKSMTWVWLIYLAAVIPLLMSVIYKWDRARWIGMVAFIVAYGFHTASLLIRWYISGRWPNANMFEAVTTSAWFGGMVALVLEVVARRTPFRNLFALGSAVASMAALMAAYFLPTGLDSSISNKMAALNDVWLYIHTNVIIASYALIALAAVTALLLLRHRWCVAWDNGSVPKIRLLIVPVAMAILNYSAYALIMHHISDVTYGLSTLNYIAMSGAFVGSAGILLLELAAAKDRMAAGGTVERSAIGGAAALMGGGAASFLKRGKPTSSEVFDGATMVLIELSFVALWAGIVMGAIWADHSWGRPWGWDPKEVFALNTFLIIIALFHVRMKVRDKGFWTAVIAVIGFEVMMFNWIVINFIVTGLHSYA